MAAPYPSSTRQNSRYHYYLVLRTQYSCVLITKRLLRLQVKLNGVLHTVYSVYLNEPSIHVIRALRIQPKLLLLLRTTVLSTSSNSTYTSNYSEYEVHYGLLPCRSVLAHRLRYSEMGLTSKVWYGHAEIAVHGGTPSHPLVHSLLLKVRWLPARFRARLDFHG